MSVDDQGTGQVSPAELAAFTRQLGAMLDAGVNVLRALRIASQNSGNGRLIEVATAISYYMEDGREFYQAVNRHPEIFGSFYVEMTRQGEADGNLGKALLAVADYLDRLAAGTPAADTEAQVIATGQVIRSGLGAVESTMIALGALTTGVGLIWWAATLWPDVVPMKLVGPLALLWSAVCMLAGAVLLKRFRPDTPPRSGPAPAKTLPAKTAERRAAETEGIVRSALQEQREEEEGAARASRPAADDPLLGEPVPPRADERAPSR